jgi:hypothetical protein
MRGDIAETGMNSPPARRIARRRSFEEPIFRTRVPVWQVERMPDIMLPFERAPGD